MRFKRTAVAVLLGFILIMTGFASAHEIIQGEQCTIQSDQTIVGNVFVLCRTLVIDGHIEGSLFGAATTAIINGTVDDDVYLAAGELDLNGKMGDDLHFMGVVLRVEPQAQFAEGKSDLLALSLSTSIAEGATIPGSVISRGYQLLIQGKITGELDFWGSALMIDGQIDNNIDATVGDAQAEAGWLVQTPLSLAKVDLVPAGLTVTKRSVLTGQLTYSAPSVGKIEAALANAPTYNPQPVGPATLTLGEEDSAQSFRQYLSQIVREFVTLTLIGAVGLLFTPRLLLSPIQNLQVRPFTSLGVGIPAFFIPVVIAFMATVLILLVVLILSLLQLTDLAIVGGLVAGLLNIGFAGLFYFIAIFVARVVVCLAVGRFIIRWTLGREVSGRILFLSLMVGTALLAVIGSLPVPVGPFTVGGVVNAIVLALGLGAILTLVQEQARVLRETPPTPPNYRLPPETPPLSLPPPPEDLMPPPTMDDAPQALGMDNLPPGFKWWDD